MGIGVSERSTGSGLTSGSTGESNLTRRYGKTGRLSSSSVSDDSSFGGGGGGISRRGETGMRGTGETS